MSNKTIINTINTSGLSSITTLTVPSSSTDRKIMIWDGTSGNSIAGGHEVTISANGDLASVNSVTFDTAATNPGSTHTLWVNTANGHLMHGTTDLEDVAVGPASSTNNAIVCWNGTTGNFIQNSTVLLSDTNVFTILGQTLLYANTAQSNFLAGKTSLGTMIGSNNTLVSIDAGTTMSSTGGFNNTGLGYGVLANIGFGSSNIAIGNAASSSYIATETSIGATGTAGEDTTIRIGTSQTACYIKGIQGITPLGTTQTVILNSDGQLSSMSSILATASEYSATISTTSPVSYTVDMQAYKVGKIVTVNLVATTFALGSPTTLISFAEVLPASYRPSAKVIFLALFISGGIWDTGLIGNIKVSAASSIVLGRDNNVAPSDFDGNAGFDSDITFTFLTA
jgi:hypothetical protein